MALKEQVLNFVKNILGHAVSGFCTGAVYELTQLIGKGDYEFKVLIVGALIGGSIGFLKSIVEALENVKPTARLGNSSMKKFFGF